MNSKKGDMLHTYIQFNEATTLVDDSKKVIDKLQTVTDIKIAWEVVNTQFKKAV